MSTQDLQLLEQWIEARDAEAFKQLAQRHGATVYGVASRILRNAADAQDVTQECFELLAFGRARPGRHLGAWLHRVATNRALNRIKGDVRRREREVRYATEHDMQTEIVWDDIAGEVDEAIAALPERYRTVIVGHFLEDRTLSVLGRELGMSRQAVRYRVDKGIALIRKTLRRRGIAMGATTLAGLLTANLGQAMALPEGLAATLGKMALAGPTSVTAAAGAAPVSGLLLGVFSLKQALVGLFVVLLAGTGTWLALENGSQPEASVSNIVQRLSPAIATPPPRAVQTTSAPVVSKAAVTGTRRITGIEALHEPGKISLVGHGLYTLTGQVVDVSGEGQQSNFHLDFRNSGYGQQTLEDGRFEVTGLEAKVPSVLWADRTVRETQEKEVSELYYFELTESGIHDVVLTLGAAASVSGSFTDAAGAPIVNENPEAMSPIECPWVYATATRGLYSGQTKVDQYGRFTLTGLAPGDYVLSGRAPLLQERTRRLSVSLAKGQHRGGLALCSDATVQLLSGRVLDGNGRAIAGAHASIRSEQPMGSHYSIDGTDKHGQFQVQAQSGRYVVQVSHDDYMKPPEIEMEAGAERMDIVLQPCPVVRGRVISAATGEPVSAYQLKAEVRLENGIGGRSSKEVEDPEGVFEMRLWSLENTNLTASAPGFKPASVELPEPRPGQIISDIIIRLDAGTPIKGTVTDEQGVPIAGVEFKLSRTYPFFGSRIVDYQAMAESGSDGAFVLDALPDDGVEVHALHQDFLPLKVDIPRAKKRDRLLKMVMDRGATLMGRVTRGGEAVGSMHLSLSSSVFSHGMSKSMLRTDTDSDGWYQFSGLAEGEYDLDGVKTGIAIRKTIQVSGEVTVVDFGQPVGGATLEGRILLGGQPAGPASASLRLLSPETGKQEGSLGAPVLPDGTYRFRDVRPGPVELQIILGQTVQRRHKVSLELQANKPTRYDCEFPPGDAELEGTVLFPEVTSFTMELTIQTNYGEEFFQAPHNFLQEDGAFHLKKLPAGEVNVRAQVTVSGTVYTKFYQVFTESGKVTHLDIGPAGGGSVNMRIKNATPGLPLMVMLLSADTVLPELSQITCDELEHLPMVWGGQPGPEGGPLNIEGVEPGPYRMVVLEFSVTAMKESKPIPGLRYGTVEVEVPESGVVETTLTLQ